MWEEWSYRDATWTGRPAGHADLQKSNATSLELVDDWSMHIVENDGFSSNSCLLTYVKYTGWTHGLLRHRPTVAGKQHVLRKFLNECCLKNPNIFQQFVSLLMLVIIAASFCIFWAITCGAMTLTAFYKRPEVINTCCCPIRRAWRLSPDIDFGPSIRAGVKHDHLYMDTRALFSDDRHRQGVVTAVVFASLAYKRLSYDELSLWS